MADGVDQIVGKITEALRVPDSAFVAAMKEPLRIHLRATFPGIAFELRPGDDFDFIANHQGDSIALSWVLAGKRTGTDPVSRERAKDFLECPLTMPGGESRPIVLWVFTHGRAIGPSGTWRFASRFDGLSALGQMGVAAIGRPVDRSVTSVTMASAYAASELYKA